jgi:hypothetical protein
MKKGTNDLNRDLSKEEIQMTKKHMNKCSTSLAFKGNGNPNHAKILLHIC